MSSDKAKPVKATFSVDESKGHINGDREISWESLPEGRYFFHFTTIKSLDSIKKIGLLPPSVHGSERYWEKYLLYDRDDRLYFFTSEQDCILWFRSEQDIDPRRKLAVLRLERSVIGGAKLFFDTLEPKLSGTSFSANVKIPTHSLEICVSTDHENKCSKWVPLIPR